MNEDIEKLQNQTIKLASISSLSVCQFISSCESISNNVDSSLLHFEMARRGGDASRRWVHRWLSLITLLTCLSVQVSAQMVRTRPLVNRLVARPH